MSRIDIHNALSLLTKNEVHASFVGDPDVVITHPRALDKADSGSLCFYRGDAPGRLAGIANKANLIIISNRLQQGLLPLGNYIITEDPDLAYCIVSALFQPVTEPQINPSSLISSSASIGDDVTIGAFSIIGENVVLEKGVIIEEHCVVRHARIGCRSRVQVGTMIGSPGLGSIEDSHGRWHDRPHFAGVQIGEDCCIQDSCVISRGVLFNTILERGVRIGPHCRLAHGVHIGEDCLIAQAVTIAGSVIIGRRTKIWGNASIRDGILVGENATIGMGSVVVKNVADGTTVFGNPAQRRDFSR